VAFLFEEHPFELLQVARTERAAQRLGGHLAGTAVIKQAAGNKWQPFVHAKQGDAHAGR